MQTDEKGEAELTLPIEEPEKSVLEKDVANQDYAYDAENHKLTMYTNEGTNKWRTEISDIRGTVIRQEIMKGVTVIEDEAFFGCTSLKEVLISLMEESLQIVRVWRPLIYLKRLGKLLDVAAKTVFTYRADKSW